VDGQVGKNIVTVLDGQRIGQLLDRRRVLDAAERIMDSHRAAIFQGKDPAQRNQVIIVCLGRWPRISTDFCGQYFVANVTDQLALA